MGSKSFLEDGELELRTVEEEDMDLLQKLLNSGKPKNPYSSVRTEKFYEEKISEGDRTCLIMSYRGEDTGMVEAKGKHLENGKIKIEVFSLQGYGKDYLSKAVEMFVDYLFTSLRLHRVGAEALETEEEKQELLENSGFKDEGINRKEVFRNGKYQNVRKYGILEGEW